MSPQYGFSSDIKKPKDVQITVLCHPVIPGQEKFQLIFFPASSNHFPLSNYCLTCHTNQANKKKYLHTPGRHPNYQFVVGVKQICQLTWDA